MCEFGYYIYSYLFSPVVNIKTKLKKKRSKYLKLLRKCYKFQEEHLKENDTGKYVIKWISGMLHMHHQAKWILNCCAHLPMSVCMRVPKWCNGWEKNSEYWLYRFKVTVHKLKKREKRGQTELKTSSYPPYNSSSRTISLKSWRQNKLTHLKLLPFRALPQ